MTTVIRLTLLLALLGTHADARLGHLLLQPGTPAIPQAVANPPPATPVAATAAPVAVPAGPPPGVPAAAQIKANGDYMGFVHMVVESLRARPLGKSAMSYFLFGLVTPELAKTGEWAEFGVGPGDNLKMLAERRAEMGSTRQVQVHGLDDFHGLSEDWNMGGYFGSALAHEGDRGGKEPFNDTRVAWHVGMLNDTAKEFADTLQSEQDHYVAPPEVANGTVASDLPGQLTVVHFNTKVASATSAAMEAVEKHLAPGAWLIFDELVNYPNYEQGEMKALYEMMMRTGRTLEVIGYEGPNINESPEELDRLSFSQGGGPLPGNALMRIL